jgi:D-inositol-3-phosphate glycosyltransferase
VAALDGLAPDARRGTDVKIAHLVGASTFAGLERHVLRLSREMRRLGHDVQIIAPAGAQKLRSVSRQDGIPCRSYWDRGAFAEVDVFHVHDGRSALAGWALATGRGTALVRTQHFVQPASAGRPRILRSGSLLAHRLLNRRVDAYIAVSEAASRAPGERDAPSDRMCVISPGIELVPEAVLSAAAQARARSAQMTVVSAGRLDPERCFDVLLDAVPEVLRHHPGTRFVLAGDGPERDALQRRAKGLGIASAFTWTGWLDDISPVLADAHIYVNTWPWEGFGLATAEAMAYALPVVAVNGGASPEIVTDGVSGRLVPPRDPGALVRALVDLLSDRAQAEVMGAAGRDEAVKRLGVAATAAQTLDLYARVLARRQHRR